MITAEEEKYILNHAYVPEHSVGLMTRVSGGEAFLLEDFFCCRKDDWIILVAYPLRGELRPGAVESLIEKTKKRFRPRFISLMAPELPPSIAGSCRERERDAYYTLDIHGTVLRSALKRAVHRARENLTLERSHLILEAHRDLIREFVDRVQPPPRVRNLFFRMQDFVGPETRSVVLNAWDREGNLAAFYVVDLAPEAFSTYVTGCHSKKVYVPGASDLLCSEMIRISREQGKDYIHLGLGVSKGIRRFKKKWGGKPTRPYEMGELVLRRPSLLDAFRAISRKM